MKKTKSQSLDSKNGLHSSLNSDDGASMIVDEDLTQPESDYSHRNVVSSSDSRSIIATNLSRKKATPPNPSTKKLVIKLIKGFFSFSLLLILGYLGFFLFCLGFLNLKFS